MARKRRRNQSSASSVLTDTKLEPEDVVEKTSICPHISKSIDPNSVKKEVTRQGGFLFLKCSKCNQDTEQSTNYLYLCLKCGSCNCEHHCIEHIECPRSDLHCLTLRLSDPWIVRCFKCNEQISDGTGKLNNCLTVLKNFKKKDVEKNSKIDNRLQQVNTDVVDKLADTMETECNVTDSPPPVIRKITPSIIKRSISPGARGLVNLGNTCFFNSVLQCLAQTPFLLEVLKETAVPGQRVDIHIDEENKMLAELESWGPLTEALAGTLEQLRVASSSPFSPGELLDALRRKCRQFVGYSQQDSHELLRQLLDSVKTEDVRRYQIHILKHFGLSKKANPGEIDEKKKELIKTVNQKLTEMVVILPDQVFKGTLVSTVQCTKCFHRSEVVENFLDLSLPVSFEKPQPPAMIRKKSNHSTSSEQQQKSKHQLKKERKAQLKKDRKLAKYKQKSDTSTTNRNADETSSATPLIPNKLNTEKRDPSESGYSSGLTVSPVHCPPQNDTDILHSALVEIAPQPPSASEPKENGIIDSSTPTDEDKDTQCCDADGESEMTSLIDGQSDPNGSEDVFTMTQYRLIEPSVAGYQRSNLNSDSSSSCSDGNEKVDIEANDGDSSDAENESDDEDEGDDDDNGVNFDNGFMENKLKITTLKPPYECVRGELSVQSCLNQFTALEILTGNNRVCCESCTEQYNKNLPNNEKKKPVYQPSTKQFLIGSPPPVLILHLKRFQGSMFALRKISEKVAYPLVLDIGPFCSAKCKKYLLPNQDTILYSLYGVVVHSGGLYGGHYIAYVKIRPPVSENSYRRSFLPGGSPINPAAFTAEDIENEINTPSSWYYISDSHVRQVSEDEVLRAEAYLLFYERIV